MVQSGNDGRSMVVGYPQLFLLHSAEFVCFRFFPSQEQRRGESHGRESADAFCSEYIRVIPMQREVHAFDRCADRTFEFQVLDQTLCI